MGDVNFTQSAVTGDLHMNSTEGNQQPRKVIVGTFAMSSSYATGGDAVVAADLGIATIAVLIPSTTDGGFALAHDAGTNTIKAFEAGVDGAALDEVTATTDLSGETASFIAIGS